MIEPGIEGRGYTNTATASYNVIHRKLQPDDIAAVQFLYGGPPASTSDAPIPLWALGALGAGIVCIARRRLKLAA